MRLLFIRHGDPDYTIDSLTEKGWKEAEFLSEKIATLDVRDFYVSPLGRAKDTASCTLKKTGRTATECEWLREFDVQIRRPDRNGDKIIRLLGNSTINPQKSGFAWFTAWMSSGRVRPQILILVLLPCFNCCSLIFSQSCPFCLPLHLPISLLFAAGQLCYLFALFFRLTFIQVLRHSAFPVPLSYPRFASGSHRSGLPLPGFFPE